MRILFVCSFFYFILKNNLTTEPTDGMLLCFHKVNITYLEEELVVAQQTEIYILFECYEIGWTI